MIATVEKIVPGAVYEGETYTQTVVVRLRDESRLRVEDPTLRCHEELTGRSAEISISSNWADTVEPVSDDRGSDDPGSDGRVEFEPFEPARGTGIERLSTTITEVGEPDGSRTPVQLELPAGELTFTFDGARLPDGVPDEYEPEVGDRLRFEGVPSVVLEDVATGRT